MSFTSRSRAYDRNRVLRQAALAQARKRRRRAISLYRQVLAVESGNLEIHAKLAPLLAETRQRFDAWRSFSAGAAGHVREGRTQQAIELYRQATHFLPREIESWLSLARILRSEGRQEDAIEALLDGRRYFRGRRRRPQAIYLLRQLREIQGWHVDALLDLARLLAASRQREEAAALLRGLAERSEGRVLRRACAAQWRLSPTLRHTWAWLRASTARSASNSPTESGADAPTRSATR